MSACYSLDFVVRRDTVEIGINTNKQWKSTKSLEDACHLIDYGILLQWREMRSIKKIYSEDEQCEIIRHFVRRLSERHDDRLACEIIVESLLIWLAHSLNEKLIIALFEELFKSGDQTTVKNFVEIALTNEITEGSHDEEIFSIAVAIICELGVAIAQFYNEHPLLLPEGNQMLDHITTYLLSVSNNSSNCIRLSLLHFFGYTCSKKADKTPFNRILSRFGHTALDHLFSLLFNKRSEAIALQYLVENLPFVLEADSDSQKILHETLKYYMLKKPERFALFIQTFADQMLIIPEQTSERNRTFLQHLGALFSVISEVNHKVLARELIIAIDKFRGIDEFHKSLIEHILADKTIRPAFKQLIEMVKVSNKGSSALDSQFRSTKRGRKPSFARMEHIGTLGQITFLGSFELAKAV